MKLFIYYIYIKIEKGLSDGLFKFYLFIEQKRWILIGIKMLEWVDESCLGRVGWRVERSMVRVVRVQLRGLLATVRPTEWHDGPRHACRFSPTWRS